MPVLGGIVDYILIVAGLAGLFLGGEALVRGSVRVAQRFAISPLIIGLTIVGFGTSTPELLVSLQAAFGGVPDIAIGNIIGSNIANILLIVGLTCLVWPIRIVAQSVRRDLFVMLGAALLLVPLFVMGEVGRLAGLVLVAGLIAYLVVTFLQSRGSAPQDEATGPVPSVAISLVWVIAGVVALMFGARFLVEGSVAIAREVGVSEAFIGLSIVAVGTSLPELVTSLIAAFRKQSDIAIGNVIGSNIFNIFGILGITAVIAPIPVADRFLTFDLPVVIGASFMLIMLILWRPQVGRLWGAVMVFAYSGYLVLAS